jgi:hypothetical protein
VIEAEVPAFVVITSLIGRKLVFQCELRAARIFVELDPNDGVLHRVLRPLEHESTPDASS